MNIVNEIWEDIPDYEGFYQVSSLGRVRSRDRSFVDKKGVTQCHKGQILRSSPTQGKYFTVNLKGNVLYIHRIVATVFCEGYFNGAHVNHKNGIKTDNRSENLEWCSQRHNNQHAHETGLINNRGEKCGACKLAESQVKEIRDLASNGVSPSIIAKKYGISVSNTNHIIKNRTWKHLTNLRVSHA